MGRKTGEVFSFEEKLRQLEEIVEKLENPSYPLEEAIELCRQGMTLYAELSERLTNLERKVYEVKNIKALAEGKESTPKLDLFLNDEREDKGENNDF